MKNVLLTVCMLLLSTFVGTMMLETAAGATPVLDRTSVVRPILPDSVSLPADSTQSSSYSQVAVHDTLTRAFPDSTNAQENVDERFLRVVRKELSALLENPLFEQTQLGLCIYDLTADRMVFQSGMKQRMRPASTMKAITAICAIDELGAQFEFSTEIRSDVSVTIDTLRTNLYIKGQMDPLFGKDDLQRFVALLLDSAVTCWRGNLVLDATLKDTLPAGWGWCWDDENPSLSPLMCDGQDVLAATFAEVLQANNIHWDGQVQYGVAPDSSVCLMRIKHSLDQVLLPMLKKSNNQMAECLFYRIAAASGNKFAQRSDAADRMNRIIRKQLDLSPDDYQIADGSGLSLYNYVSPELMVSLLRYAFEREDIFRHLYPALPIMGVDGTLKKRCKGAPAQSKVVAKTGTVNGVSALMGYATTAHGHTLCFGIINQGVVSSKLGRNFQDEVCNVLTRIY